MCATEKEYKYFHQYQLNKIFIKSDTLNTI